MKRFIAGATTVVALSPFATGCGNSESANPIAQSPAAEAPISQDDLTARDLIAKRYGSCAIRQVTNGPMDSHQRNYMEGERSTVAVTVGYTVNPEAATLMRKGPSRTLDWSKSLGNASIAQPGNTKTPSESTVGRDVMDIANSFDDTTQQPTFTFYPRTVYGAGTKMDISITAEATVNDIADWKQYRAQGSTHCGSLIMNNVVNGVGQWSIDPNPRMLLPAFDVKQF